MNLMDKKLWMIGGPGNGQQVYDPTDEAKKETTLEINVGVAGTFDYELKHMVVVLSKKQYATIEVLVYENISNDKAMEMLMGMMGFEIGEYK